MQIWKNRNSLLSQTHHNNHHAFDKNLGGRGEAEWKHSVWKVAFYHDKLKELPVVRQNRHMKVSILNVQSSKPVVLRHARRTIDKVPIQNLMYLIYL